MRKIPGSPDETGFIWIRFSYDNARLFPIEEGLRVLEALSKSVFFDPDGSIHNKPDDHVRDYRVRLYTRAELNERLVDQLLNVERDADGNVIPAAA